MAASVMAPPRRGSRGAAFAALLPLLALFLSSAFVAPARLSHKLASESRIPRNQAPQDTSLDAVAADSVMQVTTAKERLRRSLNDLAVKALEAMQPYSAGDVTDVSQIRGEWSLQVPTSGDVKGWMQRHGARFGIKLNASPLLTLGRSGTGESRSVVKFAMRETTVIQKSEFRVLSANRLLETPRSIRSDRLRLPLPALARPRTLRVTYFDNEVLVTRDEKGFSDVLWNLGYVAPRSNRRAASKAPAKQAAVSNLLPALKDYKALEKSVGALQEALQDQRTHSMREREQRDKLAKKVQRMTDEFNKVTAASQAEAVKLWALEELDGRLAESVSKHHDGVVEQSRMFEELTDEADAVRSKTTELQDVRSRATARELSLQSQIDMLRADRSKRGNERRDAYSAALKKAQEQRKDALKQVKDARWEEKKLEKQLKQALSNVAKQEGLVADSQTLLDGFESRVEQQRADIAEQRERRLAYSAKEEEMSAELELLSEELRGLDRSQVAGHELAVEAAAAFQNVAKQAHVSKREARNFAKELGRSQKAKRTVSSLRRAISHGWPWW